MVKIGQKSGQKIDQNIGQNWSNTSVRIGQNWLKNWSKHWPKLVKTKEMVKNWSKLVKTFAKIGQNLLFQCFVSPILVINLDFWQDKVFKNILQFWRKNSNIFKSKVLS